MRDVFELLGRGFEVDVVCSAGRPGTPDQHHRREEGLRVYCVPLRHRRRPIVRYPLEYLGFFLAALAVASWLGLRRRYATVQVDNLPDLLVFAAVVPRLRGARLVFNLFELMPEMAGARFSGWAGRALVRICLCVERAATSWADHLIVVNRPCFDVLRARGVPAHRMSVVLNTTTQTEALAATRLVPGGPPVLVTHTTLVERYGVHVAVAAMAHLSPAWPGLTLHVVGGGEQMGALVRLVNERGLADRVIFTGNLSWTDALEEVRRATLGIVAVVPDGYGQLLLPTKLLEYARLGVPAVCSRLPGIEAYFPSDAVTYFRPGDQLDLAEKIALVLLDPELARHQARRAQETARGLAWDHVRHDYLRALGVPDTCPAR
jgi:glycosyltransferase involved in cell wall biosynthesis